MGSYNAVVETADDGTLADAAPLVVELVAYVEEIAEVPSAIRLGGEVRLAESEVVSTLG